MANASAFWPLVRGERGAGSVLVLAATGVLVSGAVAGLLVGSAAAAAHYARTAADLAALAAAGALQAGEVDPCARAGAVARDNGADLVHCSLGVGETVTVGARRAVALGWPGIPDHAVASAKAGPAGQVSANDLAIDPSHPRVGP
ncbi:Rv3654c family TadE-like protein [Knoellia sinensis]|nr:Rv3654c family TadE-like protein [Knoellia sinensis]